MIRRTFPRLLAVLASALVLLASGPASAQTHRVLWGEYTGASTSLASVKAADQKLGRRTQLVRQFLTLDANIAAQVAPMTSDGRTPIVSFDSLYHGAFVAPSAIAAGKYDATLERLASGLAALDAKVFVTYQHEPEAGVSSGKFTKADWSAAYKRFAGFVRAAAPKVLVGPIFMGYQGEDYSGWSIWPYDDFVGVDPYAWPDGKYGGWQSPTQLLGESVPELHAKWGAPILVCETAAPQDPRKPDWLKAWPAALNAYPAVEGISYFDVDKEFDWRLDSSPASLKAARWMVQNLP